MTNKTKVTSILNSIAIIFYIFVFIQVLYGSLFMIIPLQGDEIFNYLELARKGLKFCLRNYVVPNNHILFTAIQSVLMSDWLLYINPHFLRLFNVVCFLFLSYLLFKIFFISSKKWVITIPGRAYPKVGTVQADSAKKI